MICSEHGEVGKPLSDGSCIKCERERLGEGGIAMLEVLLDMTDGGKKFVSTKKVVKETALRMANSKVGKT